MNRLANHTPWNIPLIVVLIILAFILPAASAAIPAPQIITGSAGAESPAIYGDTIVFEQNGNIVLYNRSSGEEQVIRSGHSTAPDISGSHVVWQENEVRPAISGIANSDIYLFDQTTGTVTPLAPNSWAQKEPKISGDRVVWTDYRNYSGDIYLYNITTGEETAVCTDPADQWSPQISGNTIIWLDARNGKGHNALNIATAADLYLYDIVSGTTRCLTPVTPVANVYSPLISGNTVVWIGYKNDITPRFFWYSIPSGRATILPVGTDALVTPSLSGDTLVWEEIHTSYYAPSRQPCPAEMNGQCPVETPLIRKSYSYHAYDLTRNITKTLIGQDSAMKNYMSEMRVDNTAIVYAGGHSGDGIAIDTISWDNTTPAAPVTVSPARVSSISISQHPAPARADTLAAQAWADRGRYLTSKGLYSDAVDAFDISLAMNNRSAGVWAEKGDALLIWYQRDGHELYHANDANKAYGMAVALEPGNATYWNYKGLTHYYWYDYPLAEQAFSKAVAIAPNYSAAWYNKGLVLERTQRYQEAMDAYGKALTDNPGNADYLKGMNRVRAVLNLTPLTMSPMVTTKAPSSPTGKAPVSQFLPLFGIAAGFAVLCIRKRI